MFFLLHYEFTGLVYPGIEYVDMVTKTDQEFETFLGTALLYAVNYSAMGETVHRRLDNLFEFHNGLYRDLRTNKNFIICYVDA
jgi:hypothetical protein